MDKILSVLVKNPLSVPFRKPVDPIAVNAVNYYDVITTPMDLSTIEGKLRGNLYSNNDALFHKDIQQIFTNCYTFNPVGTQVHEMGRKLEAVYSLLVAPKPLKRKSSEPPTTKKTSQIKRGKMDAQLESIASTMETVNRQLADLAGETAKPLAQVKKETKESPVASPKPEKLKPIGPKRPLGRPKGPRDPNGPKRPYKRSVPLSFEQKKKLAETIASGVLPEPAFNKVVKIIRDANPHWNGQAEISLDMNALESKVVNRLFKYVVGIVGPLTSEKAPEEGGDSDFDDPKDDKNDQDEDQNEDSFESRQEMVELPSST